MLTMVLALVVCLVGAVVFLITDKKAAQLGLFAFAVALLVTLETVSGVVTVEAHTTQHLR